MSTGRYVAAQKQPTPSVLVLVLERRVRLLLRSHYVAAQKQPTPSVLVLVLVLEPMVPLFLRNA